MSAAGQGAPSQDAWLTLLEPPALGLFHPVAVTAQRRNITGTGEAAEVPGRGVIQIAAGRGLPQPGAVHVALRASIR